MIVIGAAYAVGAAIGLSRAPTRADAVVELDRACSANDLLVTAAAIADGRSAGGRFSTFIIGDAAKQLDGVTTSSVAPVTAVPTALVVAMLAFVGPWLISAPTGMAVASELVDDAASYSHIGEALGRPGHGEIVRRSPRPAVAPGDKPVIDKPDPSNPGGAQAIKPRIPGITGDDADGAGDPGTATPSAGIGAGQGTLASDRRHQPSMPLNLRSVANTEISVDVPRGGSQPVSAAVPAAYRQIVADFQSEAE